jgi:hypothetical protein
MCIRINSGSPKVFLIKDLSDGPQNKLLLGIVYTAELIRFVDRLAFFCAGPKEHVADHDQTQDEERERSEAFLGFEMAGVTCVVKGLNFHGEP